jgi:hypothetical protein
MTVPSAAASRSARLGVAARDVDVQVSVATDKAATGGGQMASVIGRVVGTQEYRGRLRFAANGQVFVAASRLAGGVETVLTEVVVPGAIHTPNVAFRLRLQATGASPTTIRVKAWPAASVEPPTWNVTTSDTTSGLQVAGGAGLTTYLSSSASNAPVVVAFDDFGVRTDNAAPTPVIGAPVCVALSCTFTAAASSDDGTITDVAWSFGDGTTAHGVSVGYGYPSPGTYRVYATITDNRGALAYTFTDVTVA